MNINQNGFSKIGFLLAVFLIVGVGLTVYLLQRPQNYKSSAFEASSDAYNSNSATDADINGNGKVDIFDFNSLISVFGQTIAPGASSSIKVINVKAYGAKGDGQTDDTAAIQAAIDDAARLKDTGTDTYNARQVYFPAGGYAISSLNLTKRHGVKLVGEATPWSVRLYANKQTVSQPALDITGSSMHIENMTILGQNIDGSRPSVLPSVGLLIASSNIPHRDAQGNIVSRGGDSTAIGIQNVSILGYFDKSAGYIFGSNDNRFTHVSFQSWNDGAPALVITDNNSMGIASRHVDGIYQGNPYTSDQTFTYAEFHAFKYTSSGWTQNAPISSTAINLHGVNGVRFIGGVISGAGPALVYFSGADREVVFDGTFFESENGYPPEYSIYSNSANIYGLSLRNILVQNGAKTAVIGGKGGSWFYGLNIEGFVRGANSVAQTTKLFSIENAPTPDYTVISNANIAASGLDISPGGSIRSSIILNPGQISLPPGAVDTSLKSN